MGDPKKLKKKYSTPVHPWNKTNIDSERIIIKDYSLKNKKEIFIANSLLKKYKNIAKKLIAVKTAQGEKEKQQVLKKLQDLGFISAGAELDNVLGLELKDVLDRRLQSIVFRKGLARTMKQARQFIVHRHVLVGDKEISMPSYLVSLKEESELKFKDKSTLSDEEHPERVKEEVKPAEAVVVEKKTEVVTPKVKSVAMMNVDPEEEVTTEMEKELSESPEEVIEETSDKEEKVEKDNKDKTNKEEKDSKDKDVKKEAEKSAEEN